MSPWPAHNRPDARRPRGHPSRRSARGARRDRSRRSGCADGGLSAVGPASSSRRGARGERDPGVEDFESHPLPRFHLPECGKFQLWLEGERAVALERVVAASWALARESKDDGRMTLAAHWARVAARHSWTDERVLRRALLMLGRLGDRAVRPFLTAAQRRARRGAVRRDGRTRGAIAIRLTALGVQRVGAPVVRHGVDRQVRKNNLSGARMTCRSLGSGAQGGGLRHHVWGLVGTDEPGLLLLGVSRCTRVEWGYHDGEAGQRPVAALRAVVGRRPTTARSP